ncbi:MAG: peptidase M24 family protein [Acidimicrobiaceae bacterium]|nr:peptidase M24 family protein [Acidimicrobiaceae bacterium]|tara:strand:+ start:11792 stop:12892 length:1101 start_codon:yes stop_codon:yes gene_type:complete
MFAERITKVQNLMRLNNVDALLLSVGADLPYFIGYEAMPLERLTMLIIRDEGNPTLVIPQLERARVTERPTIFNICEWGETEDPIEIVATALTGSARVAIGDTTWTRFTIELLKRMPSIDLLRANPITSQLRSIKSSEELDRLQQAASAVDRIAHRLQSGQIELIGKTEKQISEELGHQIISEGHSKVNFAIVAAGENAASPHHEAGERRIQKSEIVLCDFGGTMYGDDGVGYCSDVTRCVWTGNPPQEFVEMYGVLQEAQRKQVQEATHGTPAQQVDRVGRQIISAAGYGEFFVHRTGHGIGVEAHEEPYIVEGNVDPIQFGNVFSIEPGIYIPHKWGIRLEDIVAVTESGPLPLNTVNHDLATH